jgi:hypothetical protein
LAKPIQEQFGQTIIDAVDTFARRDIPTVDDFTNTTFAHIYSPAFRRKIAETFLWSALDIQAWSRITREGCGAIGTYPRSNP